MDLLKYMPKFEGGGKDKDSAAEHVRAFKDYLAIHEVRIVAEGADEPDWELIYKWFCHGLKIRVFYFFIFLKHWK